MKKNKIVLGFARLTDIRLEEKAKTIAIALTNNINFPRPDPSLAELRADIQAFSHARKTSNGDIKKEKRICLEDTLSNLAYNVSFTANNDYDKLISSGFNVHKGTHSIHGSEEVLTSNEMPQKNDQEMIPHHHKKIYRRFYTIPQKQLN